MKEMRKNFTLIELLVVIAIIAILAGLVMPALGHAQARGRTTECINNKKQIMTVLRMYGNDHTSMIPYMISVNGTMRPYSWILAGLGGADVDAEKNYTKELVSRKVMFCNTINKKELNADGTNAVGMIDVDFGTEGEWYDDNKKSVGRFVAKDGDRTTKNRSVAYVLEKMKNPSDMILLGDSFSLVSDQDTPFWTFSPNGGKSKFNHATDASENEARIASVHVGSTTVAYADGRAEALTPAQLNTSSLKLTKYYDDNFDAKDL